MLKSFGFHLAAAAAACAMAAPSFAQTGEVAAGAAEYKIACYQCHGEAGKGDGPMAALLTVKPADLTQLAKKNDGKFPFLQVFQTIDGRAVIKAHGEGPMPIWGERYMAQSGAAGAEPYRTWTAEPFVRARILELTYYLQSIQE
ncbi:c-type cytochrome [Aestuariivirga sp.]|uniref:c-type cytochrome n=1 Tax=Aestuariivirga sp. TaxID=2650926 RepID=UPI00391D1C47